jgi:hypothetical protein
MRAASVRVEVAPSWRAASMLETTCRPETAAEAKSPEAAARIPRSVDSEQAVRLDGVDRAQQPLAQTDEGARGSAREEEARRGERDGATFLTTPHSFERKPGFLHELLRT